MSFFTPAPGFILVEPLEDEKGALTIVKTRDKEPPKKGRVILVGDPYRTEFNAYLTQPCKAGNIILHTTIGYEEFTYEHKLYRVIPFTKIIGIYENTDKNLN